MPTPKIAQVISRLCVGGASMEVVLTSESLARKGYSTLLLAGDLGWDEASLEEVARDRGVPPLKIAGLSRDSSWWRDLQAVWSLVRIFRAERPGIVHTHTAKAGALGRIAARLANVPICVHTFHGHVFEGHFSGAKAKIFLAIERGLTRWTDCVVAVSDSQRDELVNEYRVCAHDKCVTIPVGIDLDPYLQVEGRCGGVRSDCSCPPDSPLVGWIGRMSSVKAPEVFAEAASIVSRDLPAVSFVMVGDGELRSRVERQVAAPAYRAKMSLLGWAHDLPSFYADVDLVALTSRQEGTPLVLLEAMACRKPFVATNVGGIRDLMLGASCKMNGFEIFENGILADPTPAAVAAAIRHILTRPQLARQMGEAGREFAARSFSQQRLAQDIESLYEMLVRKKASPARQTQFSS